MPIKSRPPVSSLKSTQPETVVFISVDKYKVSIVKVGAVFVLSTVITKIVVSQSPVESHATMQNVSVPIKLALGEYSKQALPATMATAPTELLQVEIAAIPVFNSISGKQYLKIESWVIVAKTVSTVGPCSGVTVIKTMVVSQTAPLQNTMQDWSIPTKPVFGV